tara:strand:- start:1381 stop:2484 length:1104 start_codon:yes stop_codon:yes gene_type:complete
MRKRPDLYTNYKSESAIFSTVTQKIWFFLLISLSIFFPLYLSNYWILLVTTSLLIAIASWGLNIVSGMAGQINLAHGVFVGIGAYTSAVIGGVGTSSVIGFELDMIIWLPISGIVAALVGIIISPVSARLKGLNLGLVTLAIVFIGSHFFSNFKSVTGGAGLGRKAAKLKFLGVDLDSGLTFGNIILEKNHIIYYFSLFLCILLGIGAKNLTRTKIGRAFSAIRDRDIAAEALGINLFKYKMYAFALSSFYAGIAGSILFIISGGIEPGSFSLLYSITFIAIVIIGGVGTVLGPLYGAFFFTMLPGIIQIFLHLIGVADTDFFLNAGEIERIIFGFFIIFFLVFEPRGIWGIWFRLRNYFKAWPFSY